jgi:hypothetical protein
MTPETTSGGEGCLGGGWSACVSNNQLSFIIVNVSEEKKRNNMMEEIGDT